MNGIKEKFTPRNMWSALVLGALLISLWICAGFTVKYFVYIKQSNYSVAEVFEWGVIEVEENNFLICADFRFHTTGIDEYTSQHLFEDSPYITKESAEAAIEEMKGVERRCYWFGNPGDPKVSMVRNFPFKALVYSIISFGVLIYFAFLKKRVLAASDLS